MKIQVRGPQALKPQTVLALLGLCLLPLPALAKGHVYSFSREAKMLRGPADELVQSTTEQGKLYIAQSQVRFDQGEQVSWILNAATSELTLVRHDLRTYSVMAVPFELETFAKTAAEKSLLKEYQGQEVGSIEVKPGKETKRIGGYEAKRVDVVGLSPDGRSRVEYELWLSPALGEGEGLYRAILREFGSADLIMRPLARKMAELPGFPVLRRSVAHFPDGRLIDERRLLAVEEKDLVPQVFAPPTVYRQVPFDLTDWLTPK